MIASRSIPGRAGAPLHVVVLVVSPGFAPPRLNFVAYHYVHHLSPGCNYGLTEPSDMVWDRLLGVSTIKKLADFELKDNKKAR